MRLLYLDTGLLSYFSKNAQTIDILKNEGFTLAFSRATIGDRLSATRSKRELDFLKRTGAVYLCSDPAGALTSLPENDPHQIFNEFDPTEEKLLGLLFNRIVGGGDDTTNKDFLSTLSNVASKITGTEFSLVFPDGDDSHTKPQKAFLKAFVKSPKLQGGQSLTHFISNQTDDARTEFEKFLPQSPPLNTYDRVFAALMLNFIAQDPADGIRGKSSIASEREVLDAQHIAHGLGCDTFCTQDKKTFNKYNLLAEYWDTKGKAELMEKTKTGKLEIKTPPCGGA